MAGSKMSTEDWYPLKFKATMNKHGNNNKFEKGSLLNTFCLLGITMNLPTCKPHSLALELWKANFNW